MKKKINKIMMIELLVMIIIFLSILSYKNSVSHFYFTKGMRESDKSRKIQYFLKAYQLNTHEHLYSFSLGKALLEAKRFNEAEYYFYESFKKIPTLASMIGIANSKDLLNQYESAMDWYLKIIKINPQYEYLKINLDHLRKRMKMEQTMHS